MSRDTAEKGFTIVELMIATTVFSIILLAVTAAILSMSRAYQRSVYASNTQAAASNLVDVVAQSVKFSSSDVRPGGSPENGAVATYCIGDRQFLYVLGRKMDDLTSATTTKNVVVTRTDNKYTCNLDNIVASTPSDSRELLGRGMRLAKFSILKQNDNLYAISARVVYGDDDVLCSDSVAGSCASSGTMSPEGFRTDGVRCRPGIGSEYCAVTELSTTVYRRM